MGGPMSSLDRQITPHFAESELRCRCGCGAMLFMDAAIEKLEALRVECDFPFVISSGYRCPDHNESVSSTRSRTGPHTVREDANVVVDVLACGSHAAKIVELAPRHGFTGVGVQQKGPHGKRFIHLDAIKPGHAPTEPHAGGFHARPWIWSY